MSENIKLSGVPETMLQTVYARAKESAGRGVIRDKKQRKLSVRLTMTFRLLIVILPCETALLRAHLCSTVLQMRGFPNIPVQSL